MENCDSLGQCGLLHRYICLLVFVVDTFLKKKSKKPGYWSILGRKSDTIAERK
jgi:hypothetical protein